MAELTFVYGTMESGKTTKLLQDNFNYKKHNQKVIVIKPLIDKKGDNTVINRIGDKITVDLLIDKEDSFIEKINILKDAKAILIDEAQFLSKKQIQELWYIAHKMDISVICYGLKSNFRGEPFEGTTALFGYADKKMELSVNCECGKTAVFNARKVNDIFTFEGENVAIDGFEKVTYEPLCSDCYLNKVYVRKKN